MKKRFAATAINVKYPENVDKLLRQAAEATGKSLAEIIRETVALVWLPEEAERQGRRVRDLVGELPQVGVA